MLSASDWAPDQRILPSATMDGDSVAIRNLRRCVYRSEFDYDVHHYDLSVDLAQIDSLWLCLEPFRYGPFWLAHALVSFGFATGDYVALSFEVRKRYLGEQYSPLRGLLGRYELMCVIGDERDLIRLRSNYRRDTVYLYPVRADKAFIRSYFVNLLTLANDLRDHPVRYGLLTRSCSTDLIAEANRVNPHTLPARSRLVWPSRIDLFLHTLGYVDPERTSAELREVYRINERAERFADDPAFSQRIREL